MGKTVGKLFFFIVIVWMSGVNGASLSLRAIDTDGQELQQVAVRQPFVLEVIIHDVEEVSHAPIIAGLEQIHHSRPNVHINRDVNGNSTIRYDYTVRIDDPGTFKLGPAVIIYKGARLASNIIGITAGEQKIPQPSKSKKEKDQVLLRFSVDHERVVVGQKVQCTLRFYYSDNAVVLRRIDYSESGGFKRTNEEGPYEGTEKIDGQLYQYVEWRWQLYPQEPGKRMLPGCRADFDVKSLRDGLFRGFGAFFNPRVERKRIYSNAIHLNVESLPPHSEPVQAIGAFKHIKTSLNPSVAKEGEGMVLTVELEGEGNIDTIDQFVLRDMPEALRYYDSKNYMSQAHQNEPPKKCFEFIVQGLKVGDWEIPSQTFTYFDVIKNRYETLHSTPIITSIMRGMPPASVATNQQQPASDHHEKKIQDELSPLNYDGPWYPVRERTPLPLYVFLLVSLLPVLSSLYFLLLQSFERYRRKNNVQLLAKHAFSHARKELKEAARAGNITVLYGLFIQLIAHRCVIPISELSAARIEQLLASKEISADILVNWNYFFTQLAEYAFGKKGAIESDTHLFKQAEQWIRHLEKLL